MRGALLGPVLGLAVLGSGCKPAEKTGEKTTPPPATAVEADLASRLAGAHIDAAMAKLDLDLPDEALAEIVTALKADPASEEARSLAEGILRETTWNMPELTVRHGMPVEALAGDGSSSLWVSLGGKTNTTVHWDPAQGSLAGILFPIDATPTRSLILDAGKRSAVISRGPVTQLCDARTLKPIRDLGPLPATMTPEAVVVFSPDGLLVAHPTPASKEDSSIVWQLRDTATGQIIRSSPPLPADQPQPLCAWLDRSRLKVLHTDGSLMEMPVSPVEDIRDTPAPEPMKLTRAQFAADGDAALVLRETGSHEPATLSVISYSGRDDGSLAMDALASRFAWSNGPNLWNGLVRDPAHMPFRISENRLSLVNAPHAPLVSEAAITAAVFGIGHVITGDANGVVTVHQLLPRALEKTGELPKPVLGQAGIAALEKLSLALTGYRRDGNERTITRLSNNDRAAALEACDTAALATLFPALDLAPVITACKAIQGKEIPQEALKALRERIARTQMVRKPDTGELAKVFTDGGDEAVLGAIRSAGSSGPAAANALALALASDQPAWIEACLEHTENLPPLLRRLALSRVAWLEGKKAEALAGWPEVFPTVSEVRLREDWDGWEQADFQPALDELRECVGQELAAIAVPADSTPEQRKAVADRLKDPATVIAVGKVRFGDACLKAALAFSAHKEETETTFQLATLARDMGAPVEPCLRAEALALTAQGDYQNALPRWIQLITEHPVETHLPGDYAEAAYTAFENMDPTQAMQILTTGMHRFPADANFALRAGWVSLLTGNSERAYRFLREGQRIGYPDDKRENATALLVIAAARSGADDDAAVYFQDLLAIDPAWADAATLDTLDWPEELESTLLQFMGQ